MTTFIDSKTVLLQVNYRYMVFDHDGWFVSNVSFNDIDRVQPPLYESDIDSELMNDEYGQPQKSNRNRKDKRADVSSLNVGTGVD